MSNKENITKILLLGETGVGKSSLGNYIISKNEFLTNGYGQRQTTEIQGKISQREEYKDIYIIDSPGFQDTKKEDEKFLEKLKINFQDKNAGVRAICLLLNFSNPKFMFYLQKQIYFYCLLFPIEDFWEHFSIIFTKAYYYTPPNKFDSKKEELESEKGLINEIMNYIKNCTEKINESKKNEKNFKKIRIPNKLPAFYIDSDLEIDENENLRTKKEVHKLIEWARQKEYLDLQNINKNKIDVNYLSSKKIDDHIDEKKISEDPEKLIIKYYDKYEKTTFHNKLVKIIESDPYKIEEITTKLVDNKTDGEKTIQIYKKYKTTKEYINGIEQKDKENTIVMETITKKIEKEQTEKQIFNKDKNIYRCFEIYNEIIDIEFDDRTTKHEIKPKDKKPKYFKKVIDDGKPYNDPIDQYTTIIKKDIYISWDITDENGYTLEKGIPTYDRTENIETIIKKHIVNVDGPVIEYGDIEEKIEYKTFEENINDIGPRIMCTGQGASLIGMGALFSILFPPVGAALITSGATYIGATQGIFRNRKKNVNKKRKILFKKEYEVFYNIYNDRTRDEKYRRYVGDYEVDVGDWEEY